MLCGLLQTPPSLPLVRPPTALGAFFFFGSIAPGSQVLAHGPTPSALMTMEFENMRSLLFKPSVQRYEMGLGKTLQTIALLAWLKFERGVAGPHLVIAPLSVLGSWMTEFKRFCPELKVFT